MKFSNPYLQHNLHFKIYKMIQKRFLFQNSLKYRYLNLKANSPYEGLQSNVLFRSVQY